MKKKYIRPTIKTENLDLFGAKGGGGGTCNGTTNGQRKSTANAPESCNRSRLKT